MSPATPLLLLSLTVALAAGPTTSPTTSPATGPIAAAPAPRRTPAEQSAYNLTVIGNLVLLYQTDTRGAFPPDLPTLFGAEAVPPDTIKQVMTNPRTGRNPGYRYVKPPAGAAPATTPIFQGLTAAGQPDPAGPVLYADLHVGPASR